MLYATNGRVQDLPENQDFIFWTPDDYRRAYMVTVVQGDAIHGPVQKMFIDFATRDMLDAIGRDPCKVFVSRPKGQEVDWERFALFAAWFISDIQQTTAKSTQIRFEGCSRWFPEFLQDTANRSPAHLECISTAQAIDNIKWCVTTTGSFNQYGNCSFPGGCYPQIAQIHPPRPGVDFFATLPTVYDNYGNVKSFTPPSVNSRPETLDEAGVGEDDVIVSSDDPSNHFFPLLVFGGLAVAVGFMVWPRRNR